MPFIDLSDEEIETIYNEVIKPHWERHLRDRGVTLPRLRKPDGQFTKDALVLVYLAYGYPETRWVTKSELTEFIRRFYPETPDVQAGRHLGMQSGFFIVSTRRGNATVPKELKGAGAYRLVSWNSHTQVGVLSANEETSWILKNSRGATVTDAPHAAQRRGRRTGATLGLSQNCR
jgi:hypothetical protein